MRREDFSIALLKLNPSATFVSPPFPLLLLLLLLFALPFLARRIGTKADVKLGKLNETTAREGATFRRRGGVSRKFSTYLLHEPYTSYLCVYVYMYMYIEREREGWKNVGERSPPLPRGFITEDEVPKRPSFTRSRDRCTTRFFLFFFVERFVHPSHVSRDSRAIL